MAEKTTNFNLTKPSPEDFYDVNVQNENMDIIDEQLKGLHDNVDSVGGQLGTLNESVEGVSTDVHDVSVGLDAHKSGVNPHGITATTVGLGNVPNVATNDQTPTYTEASTLTALTSGEKLSVAFGKIKKAITDLISHIGNVNLHNRSTNTGGAVGTSASASTGGAVGNGASAFNGFAGGFDATATSGGAIGTNASADHGGAVGQWAETGNGFAGGYNAKTLNENGNPIDAVQLGGGTNNIPGTLKLYAYQLTNTAGQILTERQYTKIATRTYEGTFVAQMHSGQAFEITGIPFENYDEIRMVADITVTFPANSTAARNMHVSFGRTNTSSANTGTYVTFASLQQNQGAAAVTLTDKATMTFFGQRYSDYLMYANQYSGTPVSIVQKDTPLYLRTFVTGGVTSSTGNATVKVVLTIYGKGAL